MMASTQSVEVLVLYFSRHGATEKLARLAARGVEKAGVRARLRSCAPISGDNPCSAPVVSLQDLKECQGLIVGSPTRFGSMAAAMQAFFESTTPLWLSGALVDKPAAAFTSTSTMHGGNEATLLDLLRPLMHHGMVIVGLPYTEAALSNTEAGGSPYGASHVAGADAQRAVSADEKTLAMLLGERVGNLALRLSR
jgi:NAD(P)H dehydrogenase (quinone)